MRHASSAFVALSLAVAAVAHAQPVGDLIQRLTALAAAGNAEALYHLGMAYQTGSGVAVDHRRALTHFEQAAAKGDPLAAFKLGCFYDGQDGVVTPDADRALAFHLVAARAGYALAQQDVAGLYLRRGDAASAQHWLAEAAAQGLPAALMGMAIIYNGKTGLPRDPAKIAGYFGLFLRTTAPNAAQQQWLSDLRRTMTPEQLQSADALIAGFQPHPTALTIKGLSGARAAEALIRR